MSDEPKIEQKEDGLDIVATSDSALSLAIATKWNQGSDGVFREELRLTIRWGEGAQDTQFFGIPKPSGGIQTFGGDPGEPPKC